LVVIDLFFSFMKKQKGCIKREAYHTRPANKYKVDKEFI
jgi:hypothetical protein